MKRTYIKPFMESEEFATNEYAAACYLVTCLTDPNGENFITHKEPVFDNYDSNRDGYTDGTLPSGNYYSGKEFEHAGHQYSYSWLYEVTKWADGQHKVRSTPVTRAGTLTSGKKYGPNAS